MKTNWPGVVLHSGKQTESRSADPISIFRLQSVQRHSLRCARDLRRFSRGLGHDSGCVVGSGVGGGVSCGVSGSVGGSVSIAGDGGGDAAALETARINLLV